MSSESTSALNNFGKQDGDTYVPGYGDYLVYQLDPQASVAHIPNGDPAHTAAATLAMTCKRYVAFMRDRAAMAMPKPKHTNQITIVPLRQGLPPPYDTLPALDICVPVLPNTSHPTHRPLVAEPPLPWSDCYHAFFPCSLDVRATTTWRPYEGRRPPALSSTEWRYLCAMQTEVVNKLPKIDGKFPIEVTGPPPPTEFLIPAETDNSPQSSVDRAADNDVPAGHMDGAIDTSSIIGPDDAAAGQDAVANDHVPAEDGAITPSSTVEPDDDDRQEMEFLNDFVAVVGGFVNASLPVVNVWYDLNSVPCVEDPNDFLVEYGEMTRILGEAHERLRATLPGT